RYKPRNIADIYSAPPYKPSIRADYRHLWYLVTKTRDPQLEIIRDLQPSLGGKVEPPSKATIHRSVFDRIELGNDAYAPVILSHDYFVTDKAGSVSADRPSIDRQELRSDIQDQAWN